MRLLWCRAELWNKQRLHKEQVIRQLAIRASCWSSMPTTCSPPSYRLLHLDAKIAPILVTAKRRRLDGLVGRHDCVEELRAYNVDLSTFRVSSFVSTLQILLGVLKTCHHTDAHARPDT